MSRHQRKWSNLLLNRRFQLKYTGMLVGLSSAISLGLGAFLYEQMRVNSRMLQLDPELDAAFQEQLASSDTQSTMVMVGALLLFNLLLAFFGLLLTHKMAGPIFVMGRYLDQLSRGQLPKVRPLRKGDEFGELVDALSKTVQAQKAQIQGELALLQKIRDHMVPERSDDEVETLKAEIQRSIESKHAMIREA